MFPIVRIVLAQTELTTEFAVLELDSRAAFTIGVWGFSTLSGSFEVFIEVTEHFFSSEKYLVFKKAVCETSSLLLLQDSAPHNFRERYGN